MPITRTRELYTSPDDDCHAALLDLAKSATTSLHILIYGFTLDDLGDVLIAKHQAGMATGVVADRTQSAGPTQKALLQRLVDAGVPVTITTSSHHAIMHTKALLVDQALGALHNGSRVAYGSWNFSASANNQDNTLFVDNDPSICDYLWSQYGECEAFGKLHPDWQLQPSARIAPIAPTATGSQP